MCLYNYDANGILAEAVKSRESASLVEGYDTMYKRLIVAGIKPVIQRLDNEAYEILIKAITDKGLEYQPASPHKNQLSPAERPIETWKIIFSNLHGCDRQFPVNQLC